MSNNLTLPSGNNLTIGPDKNLMLPSFTVIARSRTARRPHPVRMPGGRVSRSLPVVLSAALSSGEIRLAQQLRARSNHVPGLMQDASTRQTCECVCHAALGCRGPRHESITALELQVR